VYYSLTQLPRAFSSQGVLNIVQQVRAKFTMFGAGEVWLGGTSFEAQKLNLHLDQGLGPGV